MEDKRGSRLNLDALFPAIETTLSPTCAANVISFVCNAWFKPCRPITLANGGQDWAPSLQCRSDCEAFRKTWNECMLQVEGDQAAKRSYDSTMMQLVRENQNLFRAKHELM
jgi:hypothetical protein